MSHLRTTARGIASTLMLVISCGFWWSAIAHADEHRYREHEFREHEFHEHQFLDARYHHDRYYPSRGDVFGTLPPAYHVVVHGGVQFFFAGGVWYRHERERFIVVAPPIGIVVPVLPPAYATVWVGGMPYYYANNIYYAQSPQGYVVVQEPPSNAVAEQPPGNGVNELGPSIPAQQAADTAQGPAGQLFTYPRQGQSQEQQAKDRYECHGWAVSQIGYDPTLHPGSASAGGADGRLADYRRAIGACLDGRGYTVK
jgi:hypothetical protein